MEPSGETTSTALIAPTPEQVLGWIAAAAGSPWFPSSYAKKTEIPRDALDGPLNELRSAELVRIAEWVRGVGQGYVLTPDGEAAVKSFTAPREPAPVPEVAAPAAIPKSELLDLRPPIVTPALLLANLLWYFIGLIVAMRLGISFKTFLLEGDSATFTRLGAVSAPDLLRGEWWRLATCCFVHGSIWHLLINLFNLGMVGALAELLWNRWRVFLIYLIAGFAGSCLAMGLSPGSMLVGASGAIWGLSTAVVAWMLLYHRRLRREVAIELGQRLALGFGLSIIVSFLPGVSWQAHLGGATVGFILAFLLNVMRTSTGVWRALAILLVAATPALCVCGLLLAIKRAPVWVAYRNPPPPADPKPHLYAIQPDQVKPVVTEARHLLSITPEKRKPERVAEVHAKVVALRSHAVEASVRLSQLLGDPEEDANRAKCKAFADARLRSLSRLLTMLESKTIPEVAVWKAWGESHHEADRLWNENVKK